MSITNCFNQKINENIENLTLIKEDKIYTKTVDSDN